MHPMPDYMDLSETGHSDFSYLPMNREEQYESHQNRCLSHLALLFFNRESIFADPPAVPIQGIKRKRVEVEQEGESESLLFRKVFSPMTSHESQLKKPRFDDSEEREKESEYDREHYENRDGVDSLQVDSNRFDVNLDSLSSGYIQDYGLLSLDERIKVLSKLSLEKPLIEIYKFAVQDSSLLEGFPQFANQYFKDFKVNGSYDELKTILSICKDALTSLDLTDCPQFNQYQLMEIGTICPSLKELKLQLENKEVTLAFLRDFKSLESLVLNIYIDIEQSELDTRLGNVINTLKKLEIDCSSLSSLDFLSRANNLTTLHITFGDSLPHKKLARIALCPKLEVLGLNSSSIQCLEGLPFQQLKVLSLDCCEEISKEELERNKESFVNIQELYLGATRVNSFQDLEFPKLQLLDLENSEDLVDNILEEVASAAPNITNLNLENSNVSSLAALEKFKCLRVLNISNCFYLKDEEFKYLKVITQSIEELSIAHASEKQLEIIGQFEFPNLKKLSLVGYNIQNLPKLKNIAPNLIELDLTGAVDLSLEEIEEHSELKTLVTTGSKIMPEKILYLKTIAPHIQVIN